jgi:ribosomal protein L11 methyltransferase
MPAFNKLTVYVPERLAQACADAIQACEEPAALAVTAFEDRESGGWMVEAYFDGAVGEDELGDIHAAVVQTAGQAPRRIFGAVPDEDWTAKVQRDLAPVRAGRFIIHGSHDRARVRPAQWAIEIEAGEAFGTAHHGTTRGCLEAIDRLALRGSFAAIADVGCGTGVLAIAAAKAWSHAQVIASDNDPIATTIAAANARLNGVGAQVETVKAVGLSHPILRARAPYDLILANILAPPLITLAPAFAQALAPRGALVLSGLLTIQMREVLGAYAARGFSCRQRIIHGEWAALVLSRGRME